MGLLVPPPLCSPQLMGRATYVIRDEDGRRLNDQLQAKSYGDHQQLARSSSAMSGSVDTPSASASAAAGSTPAEGRSHGAGGRALAKSQSFANASTGGAATLPPAGAGGGARRSLTRAKTFNPGLKLPPPPRGSNPGWTKGASAPAGRWELGTKCLIPTEAGEGEGLPVAIGPAAAGARRGEAARLEPCFYPLTSPGALGRGSCAETQPSHRGRTSLLA